MPEIVLVCCQQKGIEPNDERLYCQRGRGRETYLYTLTLCLGDLRLNVTYVYLYIAIRKPIKYMFVAFVFIYANVRNDILRSVAELITTAILVKYRPCVRW